MDPSAPAVFIRIVKEGLVFLPWEAKAFDRLELPKLLC
jgi:hypothetical protein